MKKSFDKLTAKLTTPFKIQNFLDLLAYNPDENWFRSPMSVVRDRKAHCFEGAVFAAAALRRLGYPPLIINLFPEPGTDDEHLVAVYRKNGGWGAAGQSNFVGLRWREPIYKNIRELVMSYFEHYYNMKRVKTLRFYTRPLNLASFDRKNWVECDATMFAIDEKLDSLTRIPLLTGAMKRGLNLVDKRSFKSGLIGSNANGLFKV